MKTTFLRSALLAPLLAAAMALPAAAQQLPSANPVRKMKLQARPTQTPQYTVSPNPTPASPNRRGDWQRIICQYDLTDEWTDEITLTFYVLLKTPLPKEPYILLKGEMTVVNLERGWHLATMYVHPSLLKRYGAVEGTAVEAKIKGRTVMVECSAGENTFKKWIAQLAPREGHVLPASETPFAATDFYDNDMAKPKTP